MALTETDKTYLLRLARESIEAALTGEELKAEPVSSEELRAARGAFVTLHTTSGALRGCIGQFTSDEPLFDVVTEMAASAATRDPRFPPLTVEELGDVTIEISALTPLEEIADTAAIEIGRHGIYIIKGQNRGVLLPQVATEHDFDVNTFLEETSMKAGLDRDAWKEENTRIFIFSAEIFSE